MRVIVIPLRRGGKMATMRRFVAILLLMLLPLQAIWAAAAPYCQHEDGAASHHLGHHEPEHRHATALDAPQATDAPQAMDAMHASDHGDQSSQGSDAASTHSDCHVCHGGTVLTHEVRAMPLMATTAQAAPTVAHGLPVPPTERPERPKWPALA
jgi:hypothetical protein